MRAALAPLLAGAALAACSRAGPKGAAEDPLARCAEARGGRAALEALRAVHAVGTFVRFGAAETGANMGEAFELYLRLPDRARFSFTIGRANRIALLRGEEGEERTTAAAAFTPLEGEGLLQWRRSRLLHVVAARFPALPPPYEVSSQGAGALVADGDVSLRVEVDAGSGLPFFLHFEGEAESCSLADWRSSGRGPLFPHLLRCEADGAPRWEQRVQSWSENPNLLDRLFEAPRAQEVASAPTLEAPRIRTEPAFEVAAEVPIKAFTQVANAVARFRTGRLAESRALVLLDRERKPTTVALVATSPGIPATRTFPEVEVAEVFVRGTVADALEWIGQLESFVKEEGREPEGGARLMRMPEAWNVGKEDEEEAEFRVILPIRPG